MGLEIGDSSQGMVMFYPCISIWEESSIENGF